MSELSTHIEAFLGTHANGNFIKPTCGKMEDMLVKTLQGLPKHPEWGRFHIVSAVWYVDKEHIGAISDAAKDISITGIVGFEKNPYEDDHADHAARDKRIDLIGVNNMVILLQDSNGTEYPFATTWRGEITRPLRRGPQIVTLFHQRLTELQGATNKAPLPILKRPW